MSVVLGRSFWGLVVFDIHPRLVVLCLLFVVVSRVFPLLLVGSIRR